MNEVVSKIAGEDGEKLADFLEPEVSEHQSCSPRPASLHDEIYAEDMRVQQQEQREMPLLRCAGGYCSLRPPLPQPEPG